MSPIIIESAYLATGLYCSEVITFYFYHISFLGTKSDDSLRLASKKLDAEVCFSEILPHTHKKSNLNHSYSYKQSDSTNDWKMENLSAETTSYEIKGDLPYQAYIVRLTSFNDEGDAESDPVIQTAYTGEECKFQRDL